MIYLNETHLKEIGIDWAENVKTIEAAVRCFTGREFVQPIKPYLRFRNLKNRIIAMPAFLGGDFNIAGIKWIASFPENINKNIPRAHSVVILNDADTGKPVATINTPLLSIVRTVSVSGLMLQAFNRARKLEKINIGIIGWGPIGQNHAKMCYALYGDKIENIFVYDLRPVDKNSLDANLKAKITITQSWQEAYTNSDVFITCTVSESRYINEKPKKGSLLLNVSLRDFQADTYQYIKNTIVVDDWDEVCRENTDIEMWAKEKGLKEENTHSIADVICNGYLEKVPKDEPIIFSPMGMAIFDIAIAGHFLKMAASRNVGVILE